MIRCNYFLIHFIMAARYKVFIISVLLLFVVGSSYAWSWLIAQSGDIITVAKWNEMITELQSKLWISDIDDSLTSTDTDKALSANQGRVLKDEQDLLEIMRKSQWNMSGGGTISWEIGELSISERIIWIPSWSGNGGHWNLDTLTGLVVPPWHIVYIRMTPAEIQSNVRVWWTDADVSVESYTTYTPNNNDLIIGYHNGDTNRFYLNDGRYIEPDSVSWTPNKSYVQTYKTTKNFGTGNATLLNTFPQVTIQPNKQVKLDIYVPTRANTTGWGWLYVNVNANVNGTWYNLWNTWYDGWAMFSSASTIHALNHEMLLDFIGNLWLPIDEPYTLQIELTARSYSGTTTVNGSHDINRTANLLNSRWPLQTWASDQNYTHIIIQEMDR